MEKFYNIEGLKSYINGDADKDTVQKIELLMIIEPEFGRFVKQKQSQKRKEIKLSMMDLLNNAISTLKNENFFSDVYKGIIPDNRKGA
jgi:hypothetical protein